jgi:dipeptidyl aminopeptidase/acylaminoacyl peptidase
MQTPQIRRDISSGYRVPPTPIADILLAAPTPALSIAPGGARIALLGRESLPPIADLAEPELRLAGVRINPRTNGPSRESFYNGISIREIPSGEERPVRVPADARISFPRWSPDGTSLAFVNTTPGGLELWVVDARTGESCAVVGPELNAAFTGVPFQWMPDGRQLLIARVLAERGPPPAPPTVPTGPIIQENLGKTAPARTFQDLLGSPYDERLFDYYFTSQLALVSADRGAPTPLGEAGIISSFGVAPGGAYLVVERIKRPYSYIVPFTRFPAEVSILDLEGNVIRRVADLPLADNVPITFDAVPTGPRRFGWRADAPAILTWVEALDGGDPRREAQHRDRMFVLDAPFAGEPRALITLEHRYAGTQWGRDDVTLVYSRWWNTRNERRYVVDPSQPGAEPRLLLDRSYEDRYNDPGMPLTTTNPNGRPLLLFSTDGESLFLAGEGASPRGSYPFLDRLHLGTGETTRLWQAQDPFYETVVTVLDRTGPTILTRRESATEPPNFFVRDLAAGTTTALTDFPDPAPQLAGVQRQLITYARPDGVALSATLFTPPGYDTTRDGPLPMLMWAYPREFRDADVAGQIDDSPNRFSRPGGTSHLFLLTQGYAILDGPTMPIVGEDDEEPNDTYVEQLVASAAAAVDKMVEMGVADRSRIGIGGHSYGAFMAANLLAHTDLFRAGIARSGAYNRTLTPFGFQAEQRSYWEAGDTYTRMSPFTYADRIKQPILLIHGEADNNSGTFPVQSERFYSALKGHGATARYVVLPHESHGYRARESVMHTLAEMVEWMDRYVKNSAE